MRNLGTSTGPVWGVAVFSASARRMAWEVEPRKRPTAKPAARVASVRVAFIFLLLGETDDGGGFRFFESGGFGDDPDQGAYGVD